MDTIVALAKAIRRRVSIGIRQTTDAIEFVIRIAATARRSR